MLKFHVEATVEYECSDVGLIVQQESKYQIKVVDSIWSTRNTGGAAM